MTTGQNQRVLVAEDDPALRQLLITLLKLIGIEATAAHDGLDALNQLRDNPYDLAIIDLMMPRLDGYVVVRFLEEQRPATRAIVVSAVRSAQVNELARSRVVSAVVRKPFEIDELTAKIKESLQRSV
ncbi:MAG TPA: response regulator [Thermoanaerobaculia bacterium]|nr:response regulator [Thermoanaerobaculia bacterium]